MMIVGPQEPGRHLLSTITSSQKRTTSKCPLREGQGGKKDVKRGHLPSLLSVNKLHQCGSTCRVPSDSAVETMKMTTELGPSRPRLSSWVGPAMLCNSREQSWGTAAARDL